MATLWLQGGFDIGGFFDGIVSVVIAAVDFLIQAVIFLAQLLYAVFVFLFNLLVAVFKFFLTGLVSVGKFFHSIYDVVINRGLLRLFDWLKRLHDKLYEWLSPVLKWLQRIRDWYRLFFKQWIQPILNMIQRIRQFLEILKLFHIKWAAELDAKLGELQAKITRDFLKVVQTLNQVIDWIDLVIDVNGLLRRLPLLNSIFRTLHDFRRLTFGSDPLLNPTHSDVSGTFPDNSLPTETALVDTQDAQQTGSDYLTDAADFALTVHNDYGDVPPEFVGLTG